MKKEINEQKSMDIILETIENAKENFRDDGFFYLLWGWLVLAASVLQLALIVFIETPYNWVGWPVLMTLGGILSGIHISKLSKECRVKSHFDTVMIYLWWGFMISILLILGVTFAGVLKFYMMNALIIVLFSLGTFVSGGILKFSPLKIGAVSGWIIAGFAFFVTNEYQLLLVALAIIVAYLIPGYILKYKK